MTDNGYADDVPVDFSSVITTLTQKLMHERTGLEKMLHDHEAIRDFAGFNQLVIQMQSTVRALDVVSGRVIDVYGTPIPASDSHDDEHEKQVAAALEHQQEGNKGLAPGKRGRRTAAEMARALTQQEPPAQQEQQEQT
jgi:hypothetical protein